MKVFGESIMLTRRHTRYGGDHESDLGLVVDFRGSIYLYGNANRARLYPITSDPDYVAWLLENSMDLLKLCECDPCFVWWNDRPAEEGRRKEFLFAIKEVN